VQSQQLPTESQVLEDEVLPGTESADHRGRDSESCLAMSHMYKDVCGLAQAKGLPSLIYHEPVLEVRFMRGSGHDENSDHTGFPASR
jgi:hypothetical protein